MTNPTPDLDPDEALALDAAADADESDTDPDLYEPQPGDDSYVEPGAEYLP